MKIHNFVYNVILQPYYKLSLLTVIYNIKTLYKLCILNTYYDESA